MRPVSATLSSARTAVLPALTALVLTVSLAAQTSVTIDPSQPAWIPGSSQRAVVRDSVGDLYALGVLDVGGTRPLAIFRSPNGGASWGPVVVAGINSAASGESGNVLVNVAAMAIDGQDRLHISWKQASYPSFYQSHYNTYHIPTATLGTETNLNTVYGIPVTSRDASSAILVDAQNTVWMTAPSSASWREQLLKSDAPFAATGTFTSVGVCTGTGASAQTTHLAEDASGNIHTGFYRNTSPGEVAHRMYDVTLGAWGPETALGNTVSPQDNYLDLCADYLGNVHALLIEDATGGSAATPVAPKYQYRLWNSGTWSAATTFASFTQTQLTDPAGAVSSTKVADIACNEATGEVHFVIRDFAIGGSLELSTMPLGGSLTPVATLAPASLAVNEYFAPFFRGSLSPAFDNTLNDLDIVWRQNSAAPFWYQYAKVSGTGPSASATMVGTGCLGSLAAPATLSSPAPVLGDLGFGFSIAGGPANQSAYLFPSLGPPPATPIGVGGGCQVWLDLPTALTLIQIGVSPTGPIVLDGTGGAFIPFPLPSDPAIAGLNATLQALAFDPAGPNGFVLTNGLWLVLGY